MKPISLLIAAVISLSISSKTAAQKDTSTAAIFKTWDDFLVRIKKEKKPGATTTASIESDPRLKAIKDQLLGEINQYLFAKDKAEPWKQWTSTRQPKTGDINLLPLLEGAPAPVYILPQAGQTDVDAKFDPYIKKIESEQKQLAEMVAKNSKLQQVYEKEGEDGLKKRAMAESDKNVMIQQMGGMDNLMKMSDAERKAAAMKMASNIQANPGLMSANNNPGMDAMRQKMTSDKDYMARYNKMSPAEKEAEMKKFMTQNPQEQDQNFDLNKANQQHDKLMAERNNSKYVQDITLLNMRVQNRVGAATDRYSNDVTAINKWVADVKNKIDKWYNAKFAAIPVVELGEYGHDKDPEQVQALTITVAYLNYYLLQGPEMQLRSVSWKQYKDNCKWAIAELNDFIGGYKWGSQSSENIFTPEADQEVASGIGAAYALMNQIAKEAKGSTSIARGYQKQFETITTGK